MIETKFRVHDSVKHIKKNQRMTINRVICELPKIGDTHQKPTGYYECIWFGDNASVATNQTFHEDELILIFRA